MTVMTTTELVAYHDELHRLAVEQLTRAGQLRDDAIRAAVAEGMSYREVAAAIGLSHARVGQIVNAPEGDLPSPDDVLGILKGYERIPWDG
jgi:transposase